MPAVASITVVPYFNDGSGQIAAPGKWINYTVTCKDSSGNPVPNARVCYWISGAVKTGRAGYKNALLVGSNGSAVIGIAPPAGEGYEKIYFWADEVNTTFEPGDVGTYRYCVWVKWTVAQNSWYYTLCNYINDWRRCHGKSILTYSTIGDDGCIKHAKEMSDKKAPYHTTNQHNAWQGEIVAVLPNNTSNTWAGQNPWDCFYGYMTSPGHNAILLGKASNGEYTHIATGWKTGAAWSAYPSAGNTFIYNCTIFRNGQFSTNNTISPSY